MAAKKNTATKNEQIIIPAIQTRSLQIRIVGDSPLIVHAWSEKAKRMILDKQQKKASAGKEVRNPVQEFIDSLYWLTEKPVGMDDTKHDELMEAIQNGRFGFPTTAVKAAAIDGAFRSGAIPNKVSAQGAFFIDGEMLEIEGKPHMREDMVRLGGIARAADLRYRGEFDTWAMMLNITYNERVISAEQIANMLTLGGFACGIGEWRPEKGGSFGMFHCE